MLCPQTHDAVPSELHAPGLIRTKGGRCRAFKNLMELLARPMPWWSRLLTCLRSRPRSWWSCPIARLRSWSACPPARPPDRPMPCWSRPEQSACPRWIHTIQVSRQSRVHGCTHANRGRGLLRPRPLRARSRPLASTAEVSAMAATTHGPVPLQTKLPLLPRDLPFHLLLSCKWGGRAAHVRRIGPKRQT